jgi:hypothetical protein
VPLNISLKLDLSCLTAWNDLDEAFLMFWLSSRMM